MSELRSWRLGLGLMVLAPLALELLWLLLYPTLSGDTQIAAGWAVLAVFWLAIYAGAHLLPLGAVLRGIIALIYTPVAAFSALMGGLVLGWAFHGDCL